jgi:transcriptional regulator with XRE-family HTH domain
LILWFLMARCTPVTSGALPVAGGLLIKPWLDFDLIARNNALLISRNSLNGSLMSQIMVKPVSRPLSQYSKDALALLGQLVREARLGKAMTTTDLAARAGISRALLQRIERGDPGCSIGVVFEVAALCGVPLLVQEQRQLASHLALHREKMALLPKAVRTGVKEVKDDF